MLTDAGTIMSPMQHPLQQLPGMGPPPPGSIIPNGMSPSSPDHSGGMRSPNPEIQNIAAQMLTIRMLMSGKEVGSIIGKKGDNVKKYREESGARINISDGSCPERIVTVTGTVDQIHIAFSMMCQKFEDDFTQSILRSQQSGSGIASGILPTDDAVSCPPVTLRLLVPATQCGSIIGKGGCKIKEIRELTGASIQVASEVLPNSSERTVTISGTAKAIAKCIKQLCYILLESPAKGAVIPYRPKPPMLTTSVVSMNGCPTGPLIPQGGNTAPFPFQPELNKANNPVHLSLGLSLPASLPGDPILAGGCVPAPHMAIAPSHAALGNRLSGPAPPAPTTTQELVIPNDLIGCVIGRGGTKINEIRQLSGAQIKISNCEDGAKERKITITGTPETIAAAQYLINTSIDLHKHLLALNMAVSAGLSPFHQAPGFPILKQEPQQAFMAHRGPNLMDFGYLQHPHLMQTAPDPLAFQFIMPPQQSQSPLLGKMKPGLAGMQKKPQKFAPY